MLIPIIPPIIVASNAYTIYFIDMSILFNFLSDAFFNFYFLRFELNAAIS